MKASKLLLSFILFLLMASGLLSLTSCEFSKKPSFIVIAVDRLAFSSYACSDEKSVLSSGLGVLCKEALRFTHAYTTSVQPAAALGSLLSGLYPYQHGLHRSNNRIDPSLHFLSDLALQQGYKTFFLSGSPSIMKKTGLARGFEIFDDLSFLSKKNYLSDFKDQSEFILHAMQETSEPTFSIIYNSELESLNESESEASSFEKFDEKLANFFSDLKKENLWEKNYVIVVGLQGQSDYSRPEETRFSNLHSENTNVMMFIKPPRQKGDEGINWKIDTPLTIADLGFSLMKTLKDDYLASIDDFFPILDFSVLWKGAENQSRAPILSALTQNNRKILVESANPWKENKEVRFALFYKNLLYIENVTDEIYNSLSDGLETIDISSTATSAQNDFKNENRKVLADIRSHKNLQNWSELRPKNKDWVNQNREYWSKPNSRVDLLDAEFLRFKVDQTSQPLTALMIQNLILKNRFDLLKEIGLKIDTKKANYEKEKELYFEFARRQSLNFSLENIWGLWNSQKNWAQSTFISEYQ